MPSTVLVSGKIGVDDIGNRQARRAVKPTWRPRDVVKQAETEIIEQRVRSLRLTQRCGDAFIVRRVGSLAKGFDTYLGYPKSSPMRLTGSVGGHRFESNDSSSSNAS